jgi:hypothetical protein
MARGNLSQRIRDAKSTVALEHQRRDHITLAAAMERADLQWRGALTAAGGAFEFALVMFEGQFEEPEFPEFLTETGRRAQ